WLSPQDFKVAYRSVTAPDDVCGFLAARFFVEPDDGSHREATRVALARRKATQPVGRASGGSTFRNPPRDHAARLIEAAGLKGFAIGGASVSTRHANFIINDGTATAADIEALIGHVQVAVQAHGGVRLEPEVRIVGEPGAQAGRHA
ncbi:MAG: UDP-N-acetylenolpyruvoylglucosamine reductase, partial [Sinobacteraceae bacterium]|nr:UDP-N-acetylenolpyruvoylglucosamine reductase [Nevskiaceae bacterium]